MEPTEDGAVALQILHQIPKTSDVVALEQVELFVSELEYKEKIIKLTVKPKCYSPRCSPSTLCLIDENTQLSNFN